MGRTAERAGSFDEKQRLHLVEADLDEHDSFFDQLRSELGKIKGILIGILVSVTTAAILLAINLIVSGGKP